MSTQPATSQAATTPTEKQKLDPAMMRLVVILLLGAIPALLDTTIVNVAIRTIGQDLHTTVSAIQWVITGYLLSFGMVIPLSGWALARFGGRLTWTFALSVFLAGSVLSGAAWNVGSLIGFRVLQGIGGGLLMPLLTTLLIQAAAGRQLGQLMATISLPVAVVPIFGPVISGLIISNISWRWIFYVNVPICVAGIILGWRGLAGQAQGAGARPRLDVVGLVLLCPALAGLLYGLAQVSSSGGFGHVKVLIPLLAGAVLLAGFVVYALRTPGKPLVDLHLFRARAFTGASALMFLAGLSIYGAMLIIPLYFQEARGYSALAAGLLLVPQGVGSILPRTITGKLTDKLGPGPVSMAGLVLTIIGTIPFALAGAHTSLVILAVALFVRGAGLAAATIALMAGAFQGLERSEVPDASSATRIMQQVGGAFGAAILVVILSSQATAHAAAGLAGLATAFDHTFWWTTGFAVLAFVPALLLPGRTRPDAGTGPRSKRPAPEHVANDAA